MSASERRLSQITAAQRKQSRDQLQQLLPGEVAWVGGRAKSLRFFRLLEDCNNSGTVALDAITCKIDGTGLKEEREVWSWKGMLNGAKVGYQGLFSRVNHQWVFVQGPSLEVCPSNGVINITAPSPSPAGTPLTIPYTISGIPGGVAALGVPPGMTADPTQIAGTPTTPGTYLIELYGTAPSTGYGGGSCVVSKTIVVRIT